MGDYAKPVQTHKAGAPSAASPQRDRPSFSAPSPSPAGAGDSKPPDWDGWIERAKLLGHSLENLNVPENGIRQPSVQRFVRPTLKVDRAPGVVQLGKGKIKKKSMTSTAKKSDSGVKVESAPKKDESTTPAAGSEGTTAGASAPPQEAPATTPAKKVTAPKVTGGTKQQRREAAKKAAEATKNEPAAPAGSLPTGARSSAPLQVAPTKASSKATTSSAAADAAAAAAAAAAKDSEDPSSKATDAPTKKDPAPRVTGGTKKQRRAAGATSVGATASAAAGATSTGAKAVEKVNEKSAASNSGTMKKSGKARAAGKAETAPAKEKGADDDEEPAEGQMRANRANFLKAFPDKAAVFDSSPQSFSGLQYMDPEDIKNDYENQVAGLEDQMAKMPVPDSGVGGSGDWAAGAIRREAVRTAEGDEDLYAGGKYTLHHKVAQSKLKKLLAAMEKDKEAARPMAALISQIGGDLGAESEEKILMSMPGNLEIGPDAELRTDDPGEGFDPNYESGKRTPRSEILHDVDQKLSGKFDFNYIASKLSEVHAMTKKKTQGKRHMTSPLKKQWKKDKDDKFSRS